MSNAQRFTPEQQHALADEYTQRAARCAEIGTFIQSPLGSLFWQSPAASQYKDNMTEYVNLLKQFEADFNALAARVHDDATRAQEVEAQTPGA